MAFEIAKEYIPENSKVQFDDEMLYEIISSILKDESAMEKVDTVVIKKNQPIRHYTTTMLGQT